MEIRISVDGANPEEIERGLAAARAVFDNAGMAPEDAANGHFAVEGWDDHGCDGHISDEDLKGHAVWDDANEAALMACCAGWHKPMPPSANLELVDPYRRPRKYDDWMMWGDQT